MSAARCDMSRDCARSVTHIGAGGYVYCASDAAMRRGVERTRKMRPWELRWINEGRALPSYAPGPEPRTP